MSLESARVTSFDTARFAPLVRSPGAPWRPRPCTRLAVSWVARSERRLPMERSVSSACWWLRTDCRSSNSARRDAPRTRRLTTDARPITRTRVIGHHSTPPPATAVLRHNRAASGDRPPTPRRWPPVVRACGRGLAPSPPPLGGTSVLRRRREGVALGHAGRNRPPSERGLHRRGETARLLLLGVLGPVVELGHDGAGEQLERLAHVLVAVATRLAHEDELIDAGDLVGPDELADLVGRADGAAQGAKPVFHQLRAEHLAGLRGHRPAEAERLAVGQEVLPDVGDPGTVLPEDVVVSQRVTEEVGAVEAAVDGLGLVLVTHERVYF